MKRFRISQDDFANLHMLYKLANQVIQNKQTPICNLDYQYHHIHKI